MKEILRKEELRKEYDEYKLRSIADAGIGLTELLENFSKIYKNDIQSGFDFINSLDSFGYYNTFDDWLKKYKNIDAKEEITIAEILKYRKIEIDLCVTNVTQRFSVDIYSTSLPIESISWDIAMEDEDYDNAIDSFDVWDDGGYIKKNISEKELREYLQELYNEYN